MPRSASVSRSRVRAPISGTMSSPRVSTQAIAIWATDASRALGDLAQRVDERQVVLQVLALEARRVRAEIARGRARARATNVR